MSVWDRVVGQPDAVAALSSAATASADGRAIAHAWLVTGPPGSGRSVAAVAFAAALQCERAGCGECPTCESVVARQHPDVAVVATEGMTIDIAQVRDLVSLSQRYPASGRRRVIVLEDADRMVERTWNVLLKSLEEPPPHTVWVLSAASEQDVLPTVRSRCRSVRLRIPDAAVVAEYVAELEGVSAEVALRVAQESQCHVGVARRLARDESAQTRRQLVTKLALGISGVGQAMSQAEELLRLADEDAAAELTERDAAERAELLRSLGVEAGKQVPPALRAQVKRLEDQQKKRVTRTQADVLDRALTDMQSVFRDVLVIQFGQPVALVNEVLRAELTSVAERTTPADTLRRLAAVSEARRRITGPVMLNRLLALEAMAVSLVA